MDVAEVVPEFAEAFPFDEFNAMQREAVPALLESDANVVASAPTGSGKTALAELAICQTLADGGTALFVAPLRALTNEKEDEWERFEALGYSVYVVTGERDLNPRRAERADVLVMTPEKADSATRKHDSPRYAFVTDVECVVIDEVHLLDSETRGSVLEVVVSRLRRLCDPRVVALSATMPNIGDVADWLDATPDTTFEFDDDYRPVDLHAGVRTYDHGDNPFADKYRRLFTALDLAEPHLREDGQSLVFVASRQDTVQAAKKTRDEIAQRDIPVGSRGDYDFHTATEALDNETLRKSVLDGVAFHHAGLSTTDKSHVEQWFREGKIRVLFSTSTLAWGVNLPARCVVIRDTKLHDPLEGEVDMSPLDVLQMLGRAGRPGYDDVGYGWVVCDTSDADTYRTLLDEGHEIESRLDGNLAEHLNAEIAMGTIRDLGDVMAWLETTFYYQRAQSAPDAYEFSTLRDRVRATLDDLIDQGFVETDADLGLSATRLGVLASTYYLRLDTAREFRAVIDDAADDRAILRAVAAAGEFDSVSARHSEQDAIHTVLGHSGDEMADGPRKVYAILRASMRGAVPSELRSDAWVITQNALRLLAALGAFFDRYDDALGANAAARLEARIDTGVPEAAVGLTAIEGVAAGRAHKLHDEGIDTPGDVRDAGVSGLVDAGLAPGVAESVHEQAAGLPAVAVDWGDFPDSVPAGDNDLREVTVRNHGGGANAGVTVTVNGVEMTTETSYLDGALSVPVGVFGAPDADTLTFEVTVAFAELPLPPVTETRTVDVV
ncbi:MULTISPECIES: DEAD/DEAH box helicase [Halobacterium]|uniref:DEAD/DEAH box helicase n=1 Tax=Halobacterium TaxID=2239 RepID=UPI001964F18F|nr:MULTISPECIES: DEAD/DEAH box helicase [Halobacterium]MDL0123369.1 DEAD/DEAH box helicase [Halobacterium salinarum]MDL0128889.1 DEAD/DEAH box helicase [Halobacterium salinarum]QRY24470.1 DEAD/DEAH box helicase [Halobacterium sp. BOL4-2]